MSKYTRLNKITHYHDSCSRRQQQLREPNLNITATNFNSNNMKIKSTIESTPTLTLMSESLIIETRPIIERRLAKRNNIHSKKMNRIIISSSSSNSRVSFNQSNIINLNKLAFFAFTSLIVIITLFSVIQGVYSLNCYHCSSVDNPACDEHFTGYNVTETDCEKAIGKPAKVCRKIVQYIEHKKVVIRSCGYIDDHEEKDRKAMCLKRSGTFAIMMESCNCYTDLCNHSASLVPNQSVLLLISLASCSFVFYNSLMAKRR